MVFDGLTQAQLHRGDLADAIKLVARQIEQDKDLRIHLPRDCGKMHLIDFKSREGRARGVHQSGDDAGGHIVAVRVRSDRTAGFEGGAHHPGRRGLPVRPGDDDRIHWGGQIGHDPR